MIYQTDNIDLVYVGDIHIVSGYVGTSLIFPTSEPPIPPTGDTKAILTLNDNTIVEIPWNGSSVLTSEETHDYRYGALDTSKKMKEIVITTAVTEIGDHSLREAYFLSSVTIPNTVTIIGENAFSNDWVLSSITIPNSVITIGNNAFNNCGDLTSVTIENGIEEIDTNAFGGCGFASFTIPNTVKKLGWAVFSGCYSLESIHIPASVVSIGEEPYGKSLLGTCNAVTSITVDVNNTVYDSRDNCNAIIETATNTLIQASVNTVIPTSVTSIGRNAYYGLYSMTEITIPNSIESIGKDAFNGCSGLTSVVLPNSIENIDDYAFAYCTNLKYFDFGNGIQTLGSNIFTHSYELSSILISKSTAPTIQNNTFNGVGTNGILYTPNGSNYNTWMSTDEYYLGYYDWTRLVLPTYKARYTLRDSSTVDIPLNGSYELTSGETGVLYNVASVELTNIVKIIGHGAFNGGRFITSITIPNTVTYIGNQSFYQCSGLTSITIPSGVTYIGQRAFQSCKFDSVTVYGTVGIQAFSDCTNLTSVTIGNSVDSVLDSAFYNCTNLNEIKALPTTAPRLLSSSFRNIKRNGVLKVPNGSDYSTWMQTSNYYLGYYGWTIQYE